MLKILLFIIGGIVLLAVIAYGYLKLKYVDTAAGLVKFIRDNPDRAAIQLSYNGVIVASQNPDRVMPLASTVKTILAVDFAVRCAAGEFDPDEFVPLSDLARYYVANTDGGAHDAWLKSLKDKQVSLLEVAKGMIHYSSNANTEYLTERLGIESINARMIDLDIGDYTPFYPLVGSLMVPYEAFPDLKGRKLASKLNALSPEVYRKHALNTHEKFRSDPSYLTKYKSISLKVQKVWSDRLPGATVAGYAGLMQKINTRMYFTPEAHAVLSPILEGLMEGPKNQEWLTHAGRKGGSTASVLTEAFYATDKDGNTTELAYFFNNLGIVEGIFIGEAMNEFERLIIKDSVFRASVASILGK